MLIELERFAYTPDGTFGRLMIPSFGELFTCERPWLDNQAGISCVPEGVYKLAERQSGVVFRSSGGNYSAGWELVGVPDRSYIMIHPANWPDQLKGCIAVGLSYGVISGKVGIGSSRDAFSILMEALPSGVEHEILIYQYRPTVI